MSEQMNPNNQQSETPGANQAGPGSCPACGSGGGKWFLFLIIIAVAVFGLTKLFQESGATGPAGEPISEGGIVWQTNYNAAVAMAEEQSKPMLLAFSASWCGPCQQMKKTTYHDAAVVAAAESFIPVYFDVDKTPHKDVMDRYDVQGIPCYVITKADGTVIDRFVGYHDADEFVAELQSGLSDM